MKGLKRHLPVDADGLILDRRVLPADSADRETAIGLLAAARARFPRLELAWADRGYTGECVHAAGEAVGIRVEIVAWPEQRAVWVPAGVESPPWPREFRVLRRRWIVERTFAWPGKQRRLGKEYDALPATSEGWIDLTMIRMLATRLAR